MENKLSHIPARPQPARRESSETDMGSSGDSVIEVFEREECGLVRYACGLLRRRELAEEVVQEAFLKLHEHWHEVEAPKAWLYRAVRNLSLNHLRKTQREDEDENPDDREGELMGPDQLMERYEAAGILQSLVADLDGEEQELIRLKYTQGLSYRLIGQKMKLTTGNVGYRLHHLLKGLAQKMREAGIEGSEG